MSDTSSGWTTSEDDSSGNEYSVRTKKDKLEELEQAKLNKKAKKKKKRKKSKKHKKSRYKSDPSDSDSEDENKKDYEIGNGKNNKNKDLLQNGPVKSESGNLSPVNQDQSRRNGRYGSPSKDVKSDKSTSGSQSPGKQIPLKPPAKSKIKVIPASYRSPERQKSKDQSKSKSRSKSRSRSRSKKRSRSREPLWKPPITRRRSLSRDRNSYNRNLYNRSNRERSRSRERRYRRSRSRERRNRSRSHEKRNRSRSRERRDRSRSRERRKRSRSHDRTNRSRSRDRRKSRSRSKSYDRKKYDLLSPSPKKDKSPYKDNSVVDNTISSWDVKGTPSTQINTVNMNGITPGFIPITASKTDNTLNKDKVDQVFSYSKNLVNPTKGIEIKLPPSSVDKEKGKEDPKSHLFGKWEAYEKPQDKTKVDLSKFTRMCQEISAKEGIEDFDGRQHVKKDPVHHPFTVNQASCYAPPLALNKTPTTPAEAIMAGSMLSLLAPTAEPTLTGPLEKHFPVSSGTDHRAKCNETETDVNNRNATVYEENKPREEINVSAVIARRLGAQQILQANPDDYSATLVLAECDQKLKRWSDTNKTPGKFTGELGVKMNKRQMFTVGSNDSFVRKDFFHNLRPVTGGIGMKMLQNMGWKEGQPLGKHMQGFVAPISVDVKVGRAGLSSAEEINLNQQWPTSYQTPTAMPTPMPAQKRKAAAPIVNIGGKHPVSALAEICTKRKMGIPEYSVVQESGPSYSKVFLMKVQVQNVCYQPSDPSPNKKHAKAMAATTALQTLGLVDPVA